MPRDLPALERAARAALSERYGHPLSDEEWEDAKGALLALGRLLQDWSTKPDERAA